MINPTYDAMTYKLYYEPIASTKETWSDDYYIVVAPSAADAVAICEELFSEVLDNDNLFLVRLELLSWTTIIDGRCVTGD